MLEAYTYLSTANRKTWQFCILLEIYSSGDDKRATQWSIEPGACSNTKMSLFKGKWYQLKGTTEAFCYSPAQWNFTFKTKTKHVLTLQWQGRWFKITNYQPIFLLLVPELCLVPSHHVWSHCFWNIAHYSSGSVSSYNYRFWETRFSTSQLLTF